MGSFARNSKNSRPALAIVHDAGGAEIIGAYIRAQKGKQRFCAYGAGPARNIFKRLGIPLSRIGATQRELAALMRRRSNAPYVLIAAPGWMTKTELHALQEAKRAGLTTRVYLDAWMDYRKRFGYPTPGWRKNIPDELWAGDRLAQRIAKKYLPGTPARFVPNQYVAAAKARYKKHRRGSSVLFFMSTPDRTCEKLLEAFLARLSRAPLPPTIRIRFHPASRRARALSIIRRFPKVRFEISNEDDIARDLSRARVAVGFDTVALATAGMVGVPSISVPLNADSMLLPFPRTTWVKSGMEAASVVLRLLS